MKQPALRREGLHCSGGRTSTMGSRRWQHTAPAWSCYNWWEGGTDFTSWGATFHPHMITIVRGSILWMNGGIGASKVDTVKHICRKHLSRRIKRTIMSSSGLLSLIGLFRAASVTYHASLLKPMNRVFFPVPGCVGRLANEANFWRHFMAHHPNYLVSTPMDGFVHQSESSMACRSVTLVQKIRGHTDTQQCDEWGVMRVQHEAAARSIKNSKNVSWRTGRSWKGWRC